MVSAQDSGLRGLGLVNCQGILIKCWGVTYNGQASHPDGGSKLRLDGTLGSRTNFT